MISDVIKPVLGLSCLCVGDLSAFVSILFLLSVWWSGG
jgi:hypothetical protein